MIVPNIMAYATHSAVGIYDPGRHFLDLDELTPALMGDALTAMIRHAQAVRRLDPTAWWSSVNANYLPPSGARWFTPTCSPLTTPAAWRASACWSTGRLAGTARAVLAAWWIRRPAVPGGSAIPAGSPG